MFAGCPFVCPLTSVSCNAILFSSDFVTRFSSVTGGISMKLATNIHYVNGRCWKGFHCPRSMSWRGQENFMHDGISVYLMEGFQWNLPQITVMWVGFHGQMSRSWRDQMHFCSRGCIHFSGGASRLTCFILVLFNYEFLFWFSLSQYLITCWIVPYYVILNCHQS